MNRWKVYATVIACMLFGWIGVEAHASEFNFAVHTNNSRKSSG